MDCPSGRAHPSRALNVVLLVIDDIRWDALGVAGNRIVRTPRLDRLAGEGARFRQARVTTSICMVNAQDVADIVAFLRSN